MKKSFYEDNLLVNLKAYTKKSYREIALELGKSEKQVAKWSHGRHINTELLEYAAIMLEPQMLGEMIAGHFEYYRDIKL